ncbi:S-layer homology domain-containing protein, partial [Patescibacteria group bacterium]|nr:S-layer homology domain-containing protein [Patescibacteria group bacterium]
SRGLAATILAKAAGFTDIQEQFEQNYLNHTDWTYARFPDVPMENYYAPFVAYLYDKGVISGYENNTFGPGSPITRAEIAKIVVKIMELQQ